MTEAEPSGDLVSIGAGAQSVLAAARLAMDISAVTGSPIETVYGAEAVRFFTKLYEAHHRTKFELRKPNDAEVRGGADFILLIPQFKWRRYRMDWAFKVTFLKQPLFFVECDGAEFHSTEQQIASDRAKDAAAKDAGIPLLRFSGAEILGNAVACVNATWWNIYQAYRAEWHSGLHREPI